MAVSFLGFLSASYSPDLELKKLVIWKCQWMHTQKSRMNAYSLYPQDQEIHSISMISQKTSRQQVLYYSQIP